MCKLPVLLLVMTTLSAAADYKAGVGRINITPAAPIYLSGYGNRTHPSDGKLTELWAKALALDDGAAAEWSSVRTWRVCRLRSPIRRCPRGEGITSSIARR